MDGRGGERREESPTSNDERGTCLLKFKHQFVQDDFN